MNLTKTKSRTKKSYDILFTKETLYLVRQIEQFQQQDNPIRCATTETEFDLESCVEDKELCKAILTKNIVQGKEHRETS